MESRDTLALMPTGAGKSLCYQLAAMLRPTATLVVSPLIALMKDQLDNLPPAIARQSSFINSSLDAGEASDRLRSLAAGRYKLIYAAPERLRQSSFVAALRNVQVGLVVVDEVHCVSMWGHDFRPDYLFIRTALGALGDPSVLGLTATATPATERDIALSLGRDLDVVRSSVERPNLRYDVEFVENEEERLRAAVRLARATEGSGIIYARSREKCEQVAQVLRKNRVDAVHYHARLEPPERAAVQERFLSGQARVVVATTAFGMGIDKSDIRWVLLYNFPQSVESYVQMVGRAGRDGKPSVCTLFAGGADASNLLRFARSDPPSVEGLRSVYRELRRHAEDGRVEVAAEDLTKLPSVGEGDDPRVLVGMLERAGLVRRDFDAGRCMRVELLPPPPDTADRIDKMLKQYEEAALERARRMIAFADADICRHSQIARHFGETIEAPCGMCDVCEPPASNGEGAPVGRPLPKQLAPAILAGVSALPWPVGIKGLVATLRGSVDAPSSAQGSDGFGILAAAPTAKIRRWVDALIESNNLEVFESDGFRLLRVARRDGWPQLFAGDVAVPRTSPARRSSLHDTITTHRIRADIQLSAEDQTVFDRLRQWRADLARANGIAPYMILSDKTLRAISASHPRSRAELGSLDGMGPVKLDRYGHEILSLLSPPS